MAKYLLLLSLLRGVLLGRELGIYPDFYFGSSKVKKERFHLNSTVAVKRPANLSSASCLVFRKLTE